MALGIHLKNWSALRQIATTMAGAFHTNAARYDTGSTMHQIEMRSTITGNFVSPPPRRMPMLAGIWYDIVNTTAHCSSKNCSASACVVSDSL